MPGTYQYDVEIKSNVAKLLSDMKQVQDRLDNVEGKEYKIKLNVDEKKLSSVISNLEKMLDSLGKGTGDFKQFENLSKELSNIVSEVQSLSKAFGKVDDSGAKTLLSSIQNIDKSLSELSQNILNVNKNMSNIGGNTSDAVKQVENITNESMKAKSALDDATKSQAKLNNSTEKQSIEFNTESFEKIKALFISIESSLSSIKGVLVDVGDGEELSPLLKTIANVESGIDKLSSSVKGIGLNMNIDFGSDTEMEAKVQAKISNALQAYQRLFDHIKSLSAGGSLITQKFFDFDINQFDTQMSKLQAYKKFIENMRNEAKSQFNGKDILYSETDKKYWSQASSAVGQVTKAFNEMKASTNTNPLENIFGKTDLTEVIEQLNTIVSKLDEISVSAKGFAETFKNGLNVNASVEEIEKLTNRVKELESELAKIKTPTTVTTPQESNISSASTESVTNSIKEENNVLEQNTQKIKENTQAKEQNANVNLNKYDKRLDSYNGKIDKYKTTIDRFNDGGWTSKTYLENVQAVKNAVHEYETLLNELKGKDASLVTSDDISKLDEYEKKIKDTIATVTNMSAAEKGYNFVSGQKELDKIHKLLNENSKMSSEAKAKIKAYYAEIESGNPSMSLDKIHGEILKIYNAEVEAGRAGRTLFDTLKNSGFHQIAAQMAGMVGVYDVINLGKEGFNVIKDLDYALVDLKKTTSMNESQLESYYYSSNDVAKQMGVTTEEIIDQSSAWSRLGYNTAQASKTMAELSSQFASISPGMDTTTSQEGLVSIMKAWDIDYSDVKSEIMDNINALGNSMAEDNQDIVEGMERSAAALAAVGTSYEDAFAMFSGIQEVLQNAEVSGRALRSISMRIRGYDESTEELSSDLENITGDLIDLTKTAEHTQGVSIFKDGSTTEFKSLVDYFGQINQIWDEMSQKQQNDFLQKAFGKTQAQAGAALIQNYSAVTKSLKVMEEAAGSSDREMDTVRQSITYKLNNLEQTWVGTVQNILDRGDLGTIVDGLTKVSEAIGFLISNLGLLGTAGNTISGILGAKGLGLKSKFTSQPL